MVCFPLVNKHSYGRSPVSVGKSTMNGPFQQPCWMLNYQRLVMSTSNGIIEGVKSPFWLLKFPIFNCPSRSTVNQNRDVCYPTASFLFQPGTLEPTIYIYIYIPICRLVDSVNPLGVTKFYLPGPRNQSEISFVRYQIT